MFISKTQLNKPALIGLQKTVYNRSRTHNNDLVCLEYFGNGDVTSEQVLGMCNDSGHLIHYTFAWCMPQSEYIKFHDPRFTTIIHRVIGDDGPLLIVFFCATLNIWLEYIHGKHPHKFVNIIKEQLKKDGYKL